MLFTLVHCQVVDLYNQLRNTAVGIPDNLCAGDILATLEEVSVVLAEKGISPEFQSALSTVQVVAGDLPQAAEFRVELESAMAAFEQALMYNVTITGSANPVGKGIQYHESSSSSLPSFSIYGIIASMFFLLIV